MAVYDDLHLGGLRESGAKGSLVGSNSWPCCFARWRVNEDRFAAKLGKLAMLQNKKAEAIRSGDVRLNIVYSQHDRDLQPYKTYNHTI